MSFLMKKTTNKLEQNKLFLQDFGLSVLLAVFWIASFGAWGYGQSELKNLTNPDYLRMHLPACIYENPNFINCLGISRSSVSGLTETLVCHFIVLYWY